MVGSGKNRPDSSHFGQIWSLLTMAGIWSADSNDGDQMSPDSSVGRFSIARFPRLLYSDDRLLPNFGNQISNVRVRTKRLISKNDLRFLKP
jgi:hypothetical protein